MREASSITSPIVGNNTPVFLVRDPLKLPDFIHTQKRHPRTNLRVQHLCAMRCQKTGTKPQMQSSKMQYNRNMTEFLELI